MTCRLAYIRGEWIDEGELAIPVDDAGFLLGVTVTERLRTFAGQVFRLDEHLQRMERSLQVVGLDHRQIVREVEPAIAEFIERHASQIAPGDDWGIVAFATPGAGDGPTIAVHGHPLPFAEWADAFDQGVPVVVSDHRQVPPNCWPSDLKCRSRMHYYLADRQASAREPDARGILLDQLGFVGEASTANVVVYEATAGLLTPCSDRVLPGVSLNVVEHLAAKLAIPFNQVDITPERLRAADEVWLASTSVCLLPVTACDGQPIGAGSPGAVYGKMLRAWSDLVGVDIAAQARRFASRG